MFPQPSDTVHKLVTLPRWQRSWVNDHRSINFSGLVQEIIIEVIKNQDPDYFAQYSPQLELRKTKKKEIIATIVSKQKLN